MDHFVDIDRSRDEKVIPHFEVPAENDSLGDGQAVAVFLEAQVADILQSEFLSGQDLGDDPRDGF
jgi:hypothetical protein